jgi:hypothetical protein
MSTTDYIHHYTTINTLALILTVIGLAAWIGSYFIKTKIKPQTPNIPPVPAP